MTRLEGWEQRLLRVLEDARTRPYRLGEHDCFRVACAAVEALTGVDRWPEFAGRYRTRREALVLLARHGRTFQEAGNWFFGSEAVDVRLARRGDIVCVRTPDGEHHLGVCEGERTAVLGEQGLLRLPTLAGVCCWRIG